jgi:orotate phosphoribosyltransferase
MIINPEKAAKTAEFLLQIKAIKLQPAAPFNWASGWKSPIYCDNRISLGFPEVRQFLAQNLAQAVSKKYPQAEAIAGVATGAIAIGILVAQELNLPFVYVRPEAKKHGRQNQIEGDLNGAQKVVVVEDLISTGGSSLKAVSALRDAQVNVLGMLAIFTYGFQQALDNFTNAQCALNTLCNYEHLLKKALAHGAINQETLEDLQQWRKDPANWKK